MTDRIAAEVEHDDLPDILLKAIDVIETRGWHKGDFFDYDAHYEGSRPLEQCGVCVRGALNVAAGCDPCGGASDGDVRDDAVDALAAHLGCDLEKEGSRDFLTHWNDYQATSAEQVIEALHECAAELSKETTR